ncbi:hypothetical protein JCM33374_g1159 [Metschnikowia sp. JCM 33374]|nr:hypothetical protein JCM33374_g1159 [Metschnikowia sp. JCM 33374]
MDLSGFLRWACLRGIELHSSIDVRESSLGGLGIFTTSSVKEDSVVLRIPKRSVFDLKTLLELTESIKSKDDTNVASEIMNASLHSGGHASETIIIRSFIWGLTMVQQKELFLGEKDLDRIDAYLRVLSTTPTLDIDESVDDSDFLIQELVQEKKSVRKDYLRLVKEYPETEVLMEFSQAFQLHQAVKSRVLEIPQAEADSEDYEYSTNISLVPVLDFANHCHANNAVFDVDPLSEDVILRVTRSVEALEEVTISYDPENSVNKFLKTYGFIPERPRDFCWKIPGLNSLLKNANDGQEEDYMKIAKWLQVNPELTIHNDETGKVTLDAENFRLPLLLIPGMTYYKDWFKEEVDIAEEFDEPVEGVGNIIDELKRQETCSPIVIGSETAFGVVWNDNYISIPNILEQTGTNNVPAIRLLATRAVEVVRTASRPSPRSSSLIAEPDASLGPEVSGPLAQYKLIRDEIIDKLFEISTEEILHIAENYLEKLLN